MSRPIPTIDMAAELHTAASGRREMAQLNAEDWLSDKYFPSTLGSLEEVRGECRMWLAERDALRAALVVERAKVIGLGEAEYLTACHRAAEWRSYALRLREPMEKIEALAHMALTNAPDSKQAAVWMGVGGMISEALDESNPDGDGRQR